MIFDILIKTTTSKDEAEREAQIFSFRFDTVIVWVEKDKRYMVFGRIKV